MTFPAAVYVPLAQRLFVAHYCQIASAVFLIYDYVITFGREVEMFWRTKLTGASVLFFANRYVTLLFNILALVSLGRFTEDSCPRFIKTMAGIAYFQFIIWAAFSSLRAYALCRQRVLSVFIFLLLLAPAMINYVVQYLYGITGEWDPTLGCISETNLTRKLARKLVISSRTCIITADTLLVVVTVWTLARRGVVSNMLSSSRGNLSSVMLYDGLLYFVLLLILNVLHLAFTVSAVFGNVLSNISIFTDEVIAVLVSHFIIDLQEANRRTLKLGTDDPLNFTATWSLQDHAHSLADAPGGRGATSTLDFARVMGSIASSIVPPSTEDETAYDENEAVADKHGEDMEMSARVGG